LELLEYGSNKLGHLVVELARMQDMELDFEDYEGALHDIFSKEQVDKALGILDGDEFLINIALHQDYKNMLALYDKLERKKCTMK